MYYYIFGLQCYSILKFVNFLSMQTWITSLGGLNQPSFSQTFQLCGYITYQTKLNKPLGNDHFFLDKDSLWNQAFKTIYLEVIGIQWNLPLVSSCLLLHRKRKKLCLPVYDFTKHSLSLQLVKNSNNKKTHRTCPCWRQSWR